MNCELKNVRARLEEMTNKEEKKLRGIIRIIGVANFKIKNVNEKIEKYNQLVQGVNESYKIMCEEFGETYTEIKPKLVKIHY